MDNKKDDIEVLYGSLSAKSKEMILVYTKLMATAEENARKAESTKNGEVKNASVR